MADLSFDIPHSLGAAEAKRRIARGTDKLGAMIPGGGTATPRWDGDRLDLHVAAMGQEVSAGIQVEERMVRVSVTLPPALGFLRPMIEKNIRRAGTELLQDRR